MEGKVPAELVPGDQMSNSPAGQIGLCDYRLGGFLVTPVLILVVLVVVAYLAVHDRVLLQLLELETGSSACSQQASQVSDSGVMATLIRLVALFLNRSLQQPTPTSTSSTCTTAAYGSCGSSMGTTCCPSGYYCQPWSDNYYQYILPPSQCTSQLTDTDYPGNDLKTVCLR
ncbi:unnamed protein product [Phytophthora lilii]|uniref:Unnamed protein product n=1 Tax=Phytophthora lilii TaxID=2077276 RepID=A0A9W6YHD4_9STRA|nr:unnamed protein product [Phytophthora lilii]